LDLDENSDDRTEYASVQIILYGSCLLAGHATSDWDIKNVAADSLSEWITPISPAHNDHLVTFSQRSRHSTSFGSIQTSFWINSNTRSVFGIVVAVVVVI
jgi:hypothetical protein